jgi:[ribosomal protein S5]-alanine N-acetyltransferase
MTEPIETERLILRPCQMEDLDAFAVICSDPLVMQYIGNGQPIDYAATQFLLGWIMDQHATRGFGLLAITLKETQQFLGFCGLIEQTVDEKAQIELGYRLDRGFWGKGIASEAAKAVKYYAHQTLQIAELISIIHPNNIASKRVAQKIGMQYWKKTVFKGHEVDIFHST